MTLMKVSIIYALMCNYADVEADCLTLRGYGKKRIHRTTVHPLHLVLYAYTPYNSKQSRQKSPTRFFSTKASV